MRHVCTENVVFLSWRKIYVTSGQKKTAFPRTRHEITKLTYIIVSHCIVKIKIKSPECDWDHEKWKRVKMKNEKWKTVRFSLCFLLRKCMNRTVFHFSWCPPYTISSCFFFWCFSFDLRFTLDHMKKEIESDSRILNICQFILHFVRFN